MTEAEKIAEFLARKGATRVAEGARTMSSRAMRNAVRGEPVADDAGWHVEHNTYHGDVLRNKDGEV